MQHPDKTRHNCPADECQSAAAVDAYKVAETKTDNCWRLTVWRSVGAADRWPTGMRAIKGWRGRISAWTERLWSGCGRPAVTGHIWPMVHSWTSMSGCQVSERSPVGTLHRRYHLLAVYKTPACFTVSRESLHCYELHLFPRITIYTRLPVATPPMIDRSDRRPYNKCIYCLWNQNQSQGSAVYLHGFVHQHDPK